MLRRLLEEVAGQDVIMTTISSRIPFYEPEGFERLQLKDVPRYDFFCREHRSPYRYSQAGQIYKDG
jgi:hypothetical protein